MRRGGRAGLGDMAESTVHEKRRGPGACTACQGGMGDVAGAETQAGASLSLFILVFVQRLFGAPVPE